MLESFFEAVDTLAIEGDLLLLVLLSLHLHFFHSLLKLHELLILLIIIFFILCAQSGILRWIIWIPALFLFLFSSILFLRLLLFHDCNLFYLFGRLFWSLFYKFQQIFNAHFGIFRVLGWYISTAFQNIGYFYLKRLAIKKGSSAILAILTATRFMHRIWVIWIALSIFHFASPVGTTLLAHH